MSNAKNLARLQANSSGQVLEASIADSAISASKLGTAAVTRPKIGFAGNVLQTVQMDISTVTFSADYTTGYTLSITPVSATSKLLHIFWAKTNLINSSIQTAQDYRVQRNGNTVWSASWQNYFNRSHVATDIYPPCNFMNYDFPNSTATQTYTFQGRKYGNSSGQWVCGADNGGQAPHGCWIIMEISQ